MDATCVVALDDSSSLCKEKRVASLGKGVIPSSFSESGDAGSYHDSLEVLYIGNTQTLFVFQNAKVQDDLHLEARGYRQEMPRQFSVLSLIALSFSLTCTWSGAGSSLGISLQDASAAGTLWSLPVAALMTTILSAGVAELASAFAVAGAQYYWAFCISSKEWQAFVSYMYDGPFLLLWYGINETLGRVGLVSSDGAACNFIASLILSIAYLWYPEYEAENWHQWLIYVGIVCLAVALNTFGSQFLPLFTRFLFSPVALSLRPPLPCLFAAATTTPQLPGHLERPPIVQVGKMMEWRSYWLLAMPCMPSSAQTEEIRDPAQNSQKLFYILS
ncbi:hypothetical protein BDV39DRAFT_202747 [Aspergillus sergii]|uniref:Amino acid permease-domain-containing protein n=1 Tax=Aspergillus sergii TaxID=1034303 RepID=A0A5N6XE62_9EURO|nr:hypothetical protein BDV39DRAFT_202747 [Aspergillus sergii]